MAWDVAGDASTVVRGGYGIFYQQINGETTHAAEAPWRGTTQLRQGWIEDPFGSLGRGAAARFARPVWLLAGEALPGSPCTQYPLPIRTVYTDQNLRTSYTHHFSVSVQRQLGSYLATEVSYVGKIGRDLVGHNYFNAASFINSPITGQPPTLQNVEQRVPFSPGSSARSHVCSATSSAATYHSLQVRVDRRMARTFSFSASYALSKNLTNQPENTTGLISSIPESLRPRFAVGTVVPRPASCRRRVMGLEPAVQVRQPGGGRAPEWLDAHRPAPLPVRRAAGFTMGTDVAQNGILQPNGQFALLVRDYRRRRRALSDTADMVAPYFNTAAFVPVTNVPRGIYGDAERGLIYGPGDVTRTSLSCATSPPVGPRLQVRGEFFNALNQVNFNNPNTTVSSTTFGRITSARRRTGDSTRSEVDLVNVLLTCSAERAFQAPPCAAKARAANAARRPSKEAETLCLRDIRVVSW